MIKIIDLIEKIQIIYKELDGLSDFSSIRINIKNGYIQSLREDILKQQGFPAERIARYVVLQNDKIKTNNDLDEFKNSIEKLDYEYLTGLFDEELFSFIKKRLDQYKEIKTSEGKEEIKPFHTWKNEKIKKMAYYFSHYENQEIKKDLELIVEFFRENLNKKLQSHISPIYSQQLQDAAWIALFYNDNQKHSESNQISLSIFVDEIVFSIYDPITEERKYELIYEDINNININDVIDFYKNYLNEVLPIEYINSEINKEVQKSKNNNNFPLNQILYGPPGTGKTYNTINKALEIIFQKEEDRVKEYNFKIKDSHGNEVDSIYKTYNEIQNLKENDKRIYLKGLFEYFKDNQRGQIEFVTFHQSYGYEEFVEGIKAKTDEETKKIKYEIEAGIFKKLCQKATDKEVIVDGLKINNDSKIWKISLRGTYEHPIKTKCFKDDEIRIGWNDVQTIGDENYNLLGSNDQSTIKNFIDYMEPGDIVISIYSQNEIDGIGIIESDYSQDDNSEYNKVRKVKWLSKENIINIKELNDNKILVQKTVYPIKRIKPNELLSKINMNEEKEDNANKNYVLIIDEINRGNISKIFGELITLIEPSKRIGEDEEIRLKLPYSGDSEDPFGVPSNIYIIGTMNTADRSIAQIDTALRRRFEFIEMLPKPNLLEINDEPIVIKTDEGEIEIQKLLEAINERIEYIYDREHQIGHSYFMPLKKNSSIEKLDEIFRVNIIPLLAEYFYGDWADIKFVLNDDTDSPFIIDKQENDLKYIKPGSYKNRSKIIYNVNSNDFSVTAYKNIYELKNKNEQTDNY